MGLGETRVFRAGVGGGEQEGEWAGLKVSES